MNLGKFYIDDYLTFTFKTADPVTGAATDADAVPAYRVYEDETATAIMAGNTAKLDDDNTAGFYSERIQLTSANGFEYGKCYNIYGSAAVGAVTGTDVHFFQIYSEAEHKMKRAADLMLVGTVNDADFTPTTTAFEVDGLTDATANAYKDCYIKVESGDNKFEVKKITASAVVTTRVKLTVETLTAALANGVTVLVF